MALNNSPGITGFGGYVPRLRLERTAIAVAHRWMAPGLRGLAKGKRAFCSWDEDAVTMAVEAVRDALNGRQASDYRRLTLASTRMPFANVQNSSLVASALTLPASAGTMDVGYSERAGVSGLLQALRGAAEPSIFVASDHPHGKPASTQEMAYGAGAAAFTLGTERVVAGLIGSASRNNVFVDHFRGEGERFDYFWEERWIRDEGYAKLVPEAIAAALKSADFLTIIGAASR